MFLFEKSRPPLIIDSDLGFLEAIISDPFAELAPPSISTNPLEAQIKLADRAHFYSGIFINPKMSEPNGAELIRDAYALRAGTPIYLLCDENEKVQLQESELKALGVHQILRKPMRYSDVIGLVAPLITMFDVEQALAKARQSKRQVSIEMSAEDAHFVPIHAENFLSGRKTFFDIYVRLKDGRYMKTLAAGDAFSGERLLKFVKKGFLQFYIRRETLENYLSYATLLNSSASSVAITGAGRDVKV